MQKHGGWQWISYVWLIRQNYLCFCFHREAETATDMQRKPFRRGFSEIYKIKAQQFVRNKNSRNSIMTKQCIRKTSCLPTYCTKKCCTFYFIVFYLCNSKCSVNTQSTCEESEYTPGCEYEAAGGSKPSCSCTSSANKQGPGGVWSDYRRLHDELTW